MAVGENKKKSRAATFLQPDGSIVLDITKPEPQAVFVTAGGFNTPIDSARSMAQLLICWLDSEVDEPVLAESLRRGPQDLDIDLSSFERRLKALGRFGIDVHTKRGVGGLYVRAVLPKECRILCRHVPSDDRLMQKTEDTHLDRGTPTTREFLRRHGLIGKKIPTKLVAIHSHVSLLLAIREIFIPEVKMDDELRPILWSSLIVPHAFSKKTGSSPTNPFLDAKSPGPRLETPPSDLNETLRVLAEEKRARARRDFDQCRQLRELLDAAIPLEDSSAGISTPSPAIRADRAPIDLPSSLKGAKFLASCWDDYLKCRYLELDDPVELARIKRELETFLAQEAYGSQSQRYDAINLIACIRRVQAIAELQDSRRTSASAANGQGNVWLTRWLNLVGSLERDQMVTIQEAMLANSPEHVQARLTNYGITLYQLAEGVWLQAMIASAPVKPFIIEMCALRIELAAEALCIAASMRRSVAQKKGDHLNEICFISAIRVWLQFLGPAERSNPNGLILAMAKKLVTKADGIIREIMSDSSVSGASGSVIDLADEVLRLKMLFPGDNLGANFDWKNAAAGSKDNELQWNRGLLAREEREAWKHTLRRVGLTG